MAKQYLKADYDYEVSDMLETIGQYISADHDDNGEMFYCVKIDRDTIYKVSYLIKKREELIFEHICGGIDMDEILQEIAESNECGDYKFEYRMINNETYKCRFYKEGE